MGTFEIRKSKDGFYFQLKAGNGQVVAVSGVYGNKVACENGIYSVKKNAADAKVIDKTK